MTTKHQKSDQTGMVNIYLFIPDNPPKGWKRNMGTIGWCGDMLYIPAGAAGISDQEAMLCLGHDGEKACFTNDMLLIPEEWARRNYPAHQDVYDIIRKRALEMRDSSTSPYRSQTITSQ
jgi:hypothetical protein